MFKRRGMKIIYGLRISSLMDHLPTVHEIQKGWPSPTPLPSECLWDCTTRPNSINHVSSCLTPFFERGFLYVVLAVLELTL